MKAVTLLSLGISGLLGVGLVWAYHKVNPSSKKMLALKRQMEAVTDSMSVTQEHIDLLMHEKTSLSKAAIVRPESVSKAMLESCQAAIDSMKVLQAQRIVRSDTLYARIMAKN